METVITLMLLIFAGMLGGLLLLRSKCRKLSLSLAESLHREEAANKRVGIYRCFLPDKLLRLFEQEDTGKLKIGEERNVRAAVLSYNISDFARIVRRQSTKEIFGFVNRTLSLVVPGILYQEGEIDEYVDAGLSAFFLNEPEKALCAAISICEALNQADVREQYSIGLTFGDVMVGMVGHEKRFSILTISETTGLAEFLREISIRFRARILITGSIKRQIPDFDKRYNSRYLGNIYLKTAGHSEEIYDVYDGDEPSDKNGKRKTRLLFKEGVELFQNKNYQDARLHFIEVLKANRMDGAAKEYLYLCNRCIALKDTEEDIPPYLDVY